jgi:hypothetical protein
MMFIIAILKVLQQNKNFLFCIEHPASFCIHSLESLSLTLCYFSKGKPVSSQSGPTTASTTNSHVQHSGKQEKENGSS